MAFTKKSLLIMTLWLLMGQIVFFLSACSTQPARKAGEDAGTTKAPVQASPAELAERPPVSDLDPALMYRILVGEVAGQRANLGMAARQYLVAAETSEDPEVAKRALRIAIFGKQFQQAYHAARRWVQLDPDNADARKTLAALALRTGRQEESVNEFTRMLELAPEDKMAVYDQVVAMLARETDKATGLQVMKELNERVPAGPEAYLAYGKLAANAKDWELALVNVDQALKLKPDWADAAILRANVLTQVGRGDEATASLAQLLKRQPKNNTLRLNYARMLVDRNELKQARQEFKRVARRDPDNVDVLYPLALLSMQEKDYKDARLRFEHLLTLGKREEESRFYLGNIAALQDRDEEAQKWYAQVPEGDFWMDAQTRLARLMAKEGNLAGARDKLRSLRLGHPSVASGLAIVEGELLMEAYDYVSAFALYEQFSELDPDNLDLIYGRALAAERLDRLEQAEHDLRSILEKEPENVHALNALGYTLADRTQRYEEALDFVNRAAELRPDDPAVIDSMGWVQYRLGNLEQALVHLRRAYEMTDDGEIGAHLGEVLWVSGNQRQARAIWKKSLREHPDNPILRDTVDRFTQ